MGSEIIKTLTLGSVIVVSMSKTHQYLFNIFIVGIEGFLFRRRDGELGEGKPAIQPRRGEIISIVIGVQHVVR